MQNIDIYKRRIRRFIERVHDSRYGRRVPLQADFIYHKDTPIPYTEAVSRTDYKAIAVGEKWGSLWGCAWFRFTGSVPAEMTGKAVVALIDVEGEACLFEDGVPVRGLTTHNAMHVNEAKRRVPITKSAVEGESIELLVETGANTLFGERGEDHDYLLRQAELAEYDESAWQLYLDLTFLLELAQTIDEESTRSKRLMRGLNDAANVWDEGRGLEPCRRITSELLEAPAAADAATVWSVGHAHIDLGWLWPVRETRRKAGRTFATALRMMERYPQYIFGASQPQLYQWVKEDYPQLYEQVRTRHAEGRWECQGAMWVEPDMNLAGGEALVRQCLYGRSFFRDEFGVDVDNLWLPDVFGYSAALPQILKKSGVDYFITQKISWNEMNEFPHHTFYWEGIDGTEILTHFLPTNNYNVVNNPERLIEAERRFAQGDVQADFLNLYGVGDGGGGPSRRNIEFGLRARDTDGMPKFRFAKSQQFLDHISSIPRERLPKWVGELYLELHRGTYTTQALMKKYNRGLELLLRDVEFLSALTDSYPAEALAEIWRETLLNQFHDILPGSSIGWVYQDAHEMSRKNLAKLTDLAQAALEGLHGPRSADPEYLIVYNTLSWERHAVCTIGTSLTGQREVAFEDVTGKKLPATKLDDAYIVSVDLPSMGYTTIRVVDADATESVPPEPARKYIVRTSQSTLENRYVRVTLAEDGTIAGIYDKELEREMLTGPANNLMLWEDYPYAWDAWEVSHYYRESTPTRAALVTRTIASDSPSFGAIRQALTIGDSTIEQIISLSADSRVVSVQNTVDWKESHKFLKASAEVAVHSHEATYEIQYGQVRRANHENTSWDKAKFEVAGHRYADISQPDCGFAVLNDCKYGHRIIGNQVELSLLRSPKTPDPEADMHVHFFTFAYLPHEGDLNSGEVFKAAHELNSVPIVFPTDRMPDDATRSEFSVEGGTVKIETVKQAESGSGTVLRLYEYAGTSANVVLRVARAPGEVAETTMEEQVTAQIQSVGGRVRLEFAPYEIKTIKLEG